MAGAGMVATGLLVANVASLAAFGIVIATVVTGGRAVPSMTAGALATISTPFTLAVKGVKHIFKDGNQAPKKQMPRVKP